MAPSSTTNSGGLSYKDAGVDIDAGNRLVDAIKPIAKRTHRNGVMGSLGGFGGFFEIPESYQQPVLVSGTDGVGTKLKLAMDLNKHDTIGIDLVAMCANDLIVTGAEPLFFLDYYATGALNVDMASAVIDGIGKGCELAGCALIGGETAEMPGMYSGEDYDLAGFCVGAVEKSKIISGEQIKPGDVIIGLGSSGPHSNGYSLIRKVLEKSNTPTDTKINNTPLGIALLEPTRIYAKSLLALLKDVPVHGMAHITGGGLTENIPRVLPDATKAVIDLSNWQLPSVFEWLQSAGNIAQDEMLKTFNCGVGMALIIAKSNATQTTQLLESLGETVIALGQIESSSETTPHVEYV